MPFSWKDFASKWFRCKLLVCWDQEPRTLDIAFGLTRDCRQGVSAWFSSDSSYFFLSAKYVHWERSPTGFDWGLDFGRAWMGVKQGRESWWRLLKTCFMFNRVQRGSLKPAVGSVEKSAGPEQWLWHNRKQKNTSSPECFYSEAKFLWHPWRQQNPGSPEDWALPTRHHLKADDCKGFDISSNTELS